MRSSPRADLQGKTPGATASRVLVTIEAALLASLAVARAAPPTARR